MPLSRYTTFVAGAKLPAASLEGEFDNLVDALTAAINKDISITYNNSDVASLTLDNTGSGKPLSAKIGGTEKFYISATHGQIASTVPTGQPPLIVASTTEVANLNAASVGGVAAAALAQLAATTNTFDAGANTTILLQGGTTANIVTYDDDVGAVDGQYYRIRHSGQVVTWGGSSDGSTYDLMFRLNHASGTNGAAQISTDGGSNFYDIASENYVDAKLTTISFGAFYEGALATSSKQPRFIVPADIENGDITKVYCTYQSGTVTDDSVITLTHYNAAGTSLATAPVTLLSTQTVGAAVATDITDMALSAGDQLGWTVTTASGHAEVTIWAQGTQEVI